MYTAGAAQFPSEGEGRPANIEDARARGAAAVSRRGLDAERKNAFEPNERSGSLCKDADTADLPSTPAFRNASPCGRKALDHPPGRPSGRKGRLLAKVQDVRHTRAYLYAGRRKKH